jgi:coenzyme F420 hydrogenase subunit beta
MTKEVHVETQDYASFRLRAEVIERGLCPLCGGCASGCPYLGQHSGRIVQLDCCTLSEGSCYRNCPRTYTNLDELSHAVFGEPFSADDLGVVKGAYLARATDAQVRTAAGGGGVVPALLFSALKNTSIDAVPCTGVDGEGQGELFNRNLAASSKGAGVPTPVLVTEPTAVVAHVTAPEHVARGLAAFNSIPKDSGAKLGMVCLPCQVASLRKRLGNPAESRADVRNIVLLVAEFCATKRWLEPGEDRQAANRACSYCWDWTGELADVSVGSGRGQQEWNTVFVRTAAGQRAFEAACAAGAIESKPLPAENLAQEKKASHDKKMRAVRNLAALTGSGDDLAYLGLPQGVADALRGGS